MDSDTIATDGGESTYDVIIAGAGPAGMSATLQLGRSMRDVLVCDSGEPRNGPSSSAHGYLTRDGIAPDEFRRISHDEVSAYDTVAFETVAISDAANEDGVFTVTLEDGRSCLSKKFIIATGVVDQLPNIAGFRQLWGTSVVHCPYCHGYELRDQALGVYVDSPEKAALVKLVSNLSEDLVVFVDDPETLTESTHEECTSRGIRVEAEPIVSLDETGGTLEGVVLESGRHIPRDALFYRPEVTASQALIEQFDLPLDERGLVETHRGGRTNVDGLFVAGDASSQLKQSIVHAAAEGYDAGTSANMELSFEAF